MLRVVTRAMTLLCFAVGVAVAADDTPPVAPDNTGETPQEPNITIIQRGQERIEEFSVNHQVYMIKITPAKGYPYYLIDNTGDGNFDTRRPQLTTPPVIPQWVILRWK